MKRSIMPTVSLLIAVLIMGCGECGQQGLSVLGGDPVEFANLDGQTVTARFYMLSDSSLRFVKVDLPDGNEYTLPQSISGSGARYTDDGLVTFWVRGDSAFVEMRDDQGQWQTVCGHLYAGDPE